LWRSHQQPTIKQGIVPNSKKDRREQPTVFLGFGHEAMIQHQNDDVANIECGKIIVGIPLLGVREVLPMDITSDIPVFDPMISPSDHHISSPFLLGESP